MAAPLHKLNRTVSLPVMGLRDRGAGRRPERCSTPRRSRIAKWRAASLIVVHVLIVIHLVHWLVYGWTMSPVVMSNAMYTLELGQINPAFIFFGVLILATLIFGRFFCGWACHMAALQDLCLWLLGKFGLRPSPFRSRLLPYIPVGIAFYMFVWPTFKREALAPMLSKWWPEGVRYLGHMQPFPGWSTAWTTTELWSGLPSAWVAIPFLLVCGFATVYFLGARGFCNYGCPYGGIFIPVEKLAPGRITVDPARCDACGQCTAACTSGVRVLDELRAYGSVVDSRCMKSMDCVSVCPQKALAFRFTKPAIQRPEVRGQRSEGRSSFGRQSHHTTLAEEFLLLGVFLFTLFATRGLYNVIPFLFSVGIAACVMLIAWKLLRMAPWQDANVRLHRFQFKRGGRLQPAGAVLLAAGAIGAMLLVQSAAVQYHGWRGGQLDDEVAVPREVVFAGAFHAVPEAMVQSAGLALAHYERAGSWRRHCTNGGPSVGLGLMETPSRDARSAWLHLVRGELHEAETAMQRALSRSGPSDESCADLARIMLLRGDHARAQQYLEEALAAQPRFVEVRDLLAELYVSSGRAGDARAMYDVVLTNNPDDAAARIGLARLFLNHHRPAEAADHLRRAVDLRPNDAGAARLLAIALYMQGRVDDALAELERAATTTPAAAAALQGLGAEMLNSVGRTNDAAAWRDRHVTSNR